MNKKTYITPETVVVNVELQLMQNASFSGQSTEEEDPIVGGTDFSDTDTRSRSSIFGDWDDEEF